MEGGVSVAGSAWFAPLGQPSISASRETCGAVRVRMDISAGICGKRMGGKEKEGEGEIKGEKRG